MSEPIVAPASSGSRAILVLTIVLCVLLAVAGHQIVDPRISRPVFTVAIAYNGLLSGFVPSLVRHRPRLAHWLIRIQVASLAVMLGILSRMIIR